MSSTWSSWRRFSLWMALASCRSKSARVRDASYMGEWFLCQGKGWGSRWSCSCQLACRGRACLRGAGRLQQAGQAGDDVVDLALVADQRRQQADGGFARHRDQQALLGQRAAHQVLAGAGQLDRSEEGRGGEKGR